MKLIHYKNLLSEEIDAVTNVSNKSGFRKTLENKYKKLQKNLNAKYERMNRDRNFKADQKMFGSANKEYEKKYNTAGPYQWWSNTYGNLRNSKEADIINRRLPKISNVYLSKR